MPRLAAARVARLATIDPDGRPHLVPIVFALDAKTLYSVARPGDLERSHLPSTRMYCAS